MAHRVEYGIALEEKRKFGQEYNPAYEKEDIFITWAKEKW